MKVLVAGAGIGGLTTALALQRAGHQVQVYEAAPSIEPVGAGIWLAPNGQEVLRRIDDDILRSVQSAGLLMDAARITDITGRTLSRIDYPVLAIRRSDLHRVLHDALLPGTVRLDHRVQRYEDGSGVRAHFHNGAQADGEVLIGADGINSPVRAQMFGPAPLRYSGQTCWRGLSRMRLPDEWSGQGVEIWADAPGLRVGFSQVSEDDVYFYVTALAPPGQRDVALGDLHSHLTVFPPVVRDVVEATPDGRIIRSDLNDLKPLKRWTRGRVALLGDAAHATLPNLGQGANQAMESALALRHFLDGVTSQHAEAALSAYERARITKATYVVNTSWRIGKVINWRPRWARRFRDAVMTRTPDSASRRQFQRIFEVPADWGRA